MQLCTKIEFDCAATVTLEQASTGRFRVTYGKYVRRNLEYTDAAIEFGECIMHALACDGKLDSDVS